MHEYSIVQSMLEICKEHAKGQLVDKVVVKIGKMSGIEPHFLKESFEVFKENTLCKDAVLEIKEVDIVVLCLSCNQKAKIEDWDFFCPYCKSDNTKVLSGQEMHIEYIELKEQ